MSEQKRPYIEIEHFSFYYPERTEKVLDDLTLTVEQGEFLVLCGPSGCGKSTLLRQLKTVLAPHGRRLGSIHFEGRPLEELDQREQSARNRLCAAGPRKPDCHRQGVARTRLWPGEPGV